MRGVHEGGGFEGRYSCCGRRRRGSRWVAMGVVEGGGFEGRWSCCGGRRRGSRWVVRGATEIDVELGGRSHSPSH